MGELRSMATNNIVLNKYKREKEKRILKIALLIIFSYNTIGCKNHNKKFIEKYDREKFSVFKNRSIYYRGVDENWNPIVLINVNVSTSRKCTMPLGITIDRKTHQVLEINDRWLPDSCGIDKMMLAKQALYFTKYGIEYLDVDSNMNVFISVANEGRPDLVRFADLKYKTKEFERWQRIKGNWYEYVE